MSNRKPFSELTKTITPERRAYIEERKIELREEMALADLRQAMGVSQEELAKHLKVQQPAVAKLEKRGDIRISSLSKMIEAMGGSLEIKAHFPTGDVTISNFQRS
jgi:ribosome-binding protein aMBF1 (putative translation factor)